MGQEAYNKLKKRMAEQARNMGKQPNVRAIEKRAMEVAKKADRKNERRG